MPDADLFLHASEIIQQVVRSLFVVTGNPAMMKNPIPVFLLAVVGLLAGCNNAPAANNTAAAPDFGPAIDFTLATVDGDDLTLSARAAERPQIVLFWATWCPYCRAVMPHLQSILLEHPEQMDLLAVNIAEDGDPVAYLQENGLSFTLLPDGDAVAGEWGVDGTPAVFLIDTNSHVRFDLDKVPRLVLKSEGKKLSHRAAAARLAPYWAAELRKAIDGLE